MRRYSKQIRLTILALSALIAGAFGSWMLSGGGFRTATPEKPLTPKNVTTESVTPEPAPPTGAKNPVADPSAEAALADVLARTQEYQAFFGRLRALYPSDWTAALREGAGQNIQAQDNAADVFLTEAVRLLRQTRGRSGAKAGAQALDRLFDQHLQVMRELAKADSSLCVDFLNGAPAEKFLAFTSGHRALMAEQALAGLDAIDDGARKKIDREAPTPGDFDDLEKALLTHGLDKAAIGLLLDGKQPEPPISDEKACKNGLTYLETLKSMPDATRLRLYALALEVMAHE